MDALLEGQVRGATALTAAAHLDGDGVSLDALKVEVLQDAFRV